MTSTMGIYNTDGVIESVMHGPFRASDLLPGQGAVVIPPGEDWRDYYVDVANGSSLTAISNLAAAWSPSMSAPAGSTFTLSPLPLGKIYIDNVLVSEITDPAVDDSFGVTLSDVGSYEIRVCAVGYREELYMLEAL